MLSGYEISKSIKGRDILTRINVSVKPGSITVLIGPSGGGKSTLIRTLSLLEFPDTGIISVDDQQIKFPLREKTRLKTPLKLYPRITVVFQQFHLWPHLTIRENLLMPVKLQGISVDNSDFEYLISYFEIDTLLDRYPHQVSVGQKQRAAFIRAVLLKPKYLLLDEITSSIDIRHIGKVLSYIQELAKSGTGIMIATHLLGFAATVASEIVFLDSGKVIENGDISILKSPKTKLLSDFLSYLEYAG